MTRHTIFRVLHGLGFLTFTVWGLVLALRPGCETTGVVFLVVAATLAVTVE